MTTHAPQNNSTHSQKTRDYEAERNGIMRQIQSLRDEKYMTEMSSDTAYNNGTIKRLNESISALQNKLANMP